MSEEQRAEPIRWSADGMVCYVDGLAWGLSGGYTICLGKVEEVMKNHPLPGRSKQPLEFRKKEGCSATDDADYGSPNLPTMQPKWAGNPAEKGNL